jgi:hypothetical protein
MKFRDLVGRAVSGVREDQHKLALSEQITLIKQLYGQQCVKYESISGERTTSITVSTIVSMK